MSKKTKKPSDIHANFLHQQGLGPKPVDESHVLKVPAGSQADERRGERSIGKSPLLAAPFGREESEDMAQRFRDAYSGIAAFWHQTVTGAALQTLWQVAERHNVIGEAARIRQCAVIIGTEMQAPEKRVADLLAANNALLEREREARRELRDVTLMLRVAMRALGTAERRGASPKDISAFLEKARRDVLGETK